jgi:hypothetical protein
MTLLRFAWMLAMVHQTSELFFEATFYHFGSACLFREGIEASGD